MAARAFSRFILLVAVVFLGAGCAGSQQTATNAPTDEDRNTVTAEDIDQSPTATGRAEEVLAGRISGVNVYRTSDGGIQIQIRGRNSILGSSQPLYVVDGMPVNAGPRGALYGINPQDIASIRVLKNASETALYGMRGANGVVLVETKRGK